MPTRALLCLIASTLLPAADPLPAPTFTDADRTRKLATAFPEIDRIFLRYANQRKLPGMVWGVVVDARLAHLGTFGVRDRNPESPVRADTVFRIASMTKSFTALAILKLRDDNKLSLEDPLSRWIPEFASMEMPVRDAGVIRIRHLLTHGAGFPEDNPWGDQQLGASDEQLTAWLKKGIPFATAPGDRYEYSNYGFAILGRVITKASGVPYEEYVSSNILQPLKMTSSTFEASSVAAGRRAAGYRLLPDGSYQEEPPLPHGAFGAMGGLMVSADDLARYIAFHLSAWPPRDAPEAGPVRRSSVREMNLMSRFSNLTVTREDNTISGEVRGYGYGLRISADCRFDHVAGHGGGLPGFGSYMAWLPDYGVGVFAMANLTYVGPSQPINEAWDSLRRTGGLRKRELPVSPLLTSVRDRIVRLWRNWNEQDAAKLGAMNLLLDIPSRQRQRQIEALKSEVGKCPATGEVIPENHLRGQFTMQCEKGNVDVVFSLAPTQPPAVQHLSFQKRTGPAKQLSAPTSGVPGVSCPE